MFKKVLITCTALLFGFHSFAQQARTRWVDSVFQTLTEEEKIGQMMMVSVSAYATEEEREEFLENINDDGIGGVLITKGGPYSVTRLLNKLQTDNKIPLLTGIHAAWGVGQTLDSTMSFYKPLLMGALTDSLATEAGKEIGREMKRLGLHLNFAPNADNDIREEIYPNTLQYFSDNKKVVARRSLAFMKGLQSQKILTCAPFLPDVKKDKLFPPFTEKRRRAKKKKGVDSTIYYNVNKIDTLDFFSYRGLMNNGLTGMLTSHLHFTMLDNNQPIPASVSQIFFNDVLKKKMDYQGLTFAEIPYLQKITNKDRGGETELLAFLAGNDVLIDPGNVNATIRKIQRAIKKDDALQAQLNTSVKKILFAKYDAGLAQPTSVSEDNLLQQLKPLRAQLLKNKLAESIVTVVRNTAGLLPVPYLEDQQFASLTLGKEEKNEFNHYLNKYAPFNHFTIRTLADTTGVYTELSKHNVIVVSVFPFASSFELDIVPQIKKLAQTKKVIVCLFGDPSSIKNYYEINTVITAYEDDPLLTKVAAEIIFGGLKAKGTLPLAPSLLIAQGTGVATESRDRFTYALPEEAGMDSKTLEAIAPIAREAIDMGATPGCMVLVVKDGKVVYERAFGWQTYENTVPVTDETIYDLASVTKVSATLQTVMFMHEKGLIDIHKKVSYYLPELKNSNKKDFTIKDIITHQAGLWPFLPFWASTTTSVNKDSKVLPFYYSKKQSDDYPFPVADSLYAFKNMKDSLWQWIIKAKIVDKVVRTPYDYRYSDMGFYIMQHLAEKMLNQPIEDFLDQNLYEPLGAYTTGYLPRRRFPASQIAPTENDILFRKRLLVGYVHDQGAAMHGGIAGHAGLFSDANDLAKLGQMWLNKGHYGGVQFFKPETIELFTTKQFENSRRGLGWDKPVISDWNGPTSLLASPLTFGHTGFTGTCIWVDPKFNLVFVFLSNRVYPDMTNNKLLNANIRPRIQEVVYKAIFNYCADHDTTTKLN